PDGSPTPIGQGFNERPDLPYPLEVGRPGTHLVRDKDDALSTPVLLFPDFQPANEAVHDGGHVRLAEVVEGELKTAMGLLGRGVALGLQLRKAASEDRVGALHVLVFRPGNT